MSLEGKPVRASRVECTEIIQPNDANPLGTVFGGKVMAMIDVVGALAAQRHARKVCVTAAIDALQFLAPAKVGHFLIVRAQVNFVAHTSMEVGVEVFAEDPLTGESRQTSTAFVTFVALDSFGRPSPVPPVIPETDVEQRAFEEAKGRREARLARRGEAQRSKGGA
ncbi:MAG: acyl-CoA thioesterase [Acidobacteriota bacterium]